uniref:Uncharacterized protein n=1 Tax=Anguilla anguilla TaxID=7936 RepID=A0A0E9WR66_ANGAN
MIALRSSGDHVGSPISGGGGRTGEANVPVSAPPPPNNAPSLRRLIIYHNQENTAKIRTEGSRIHTSVDQSFGWF